MNIFLHQISYVNLPKNSAPAAHHIDSWPKINPEFHKHHWKSYILQREHIRKGILSQCPMYAFIRDNWKPYNRELCNWGGGSGMRQTPDSSLIYIPAKERKKIHWTNRRTQTWTWFSNLVARYSCGMGDAYITEYFHLKVWISLKSFGNENAATSRALGRTFYC